MNATSAEAGTSAVPYSEIPYIPQRWRWEGFLPVGKPVVFAAAGGTGKGMLMSASVARIVLGLPFPGDDPSVRYPPQRALWITGQGEDDQYEDLAPRLRAAIAAAAVEHGLDLAEASAAIGLVCDLSEWADGTPVTLPADCSRLAGEIGRLNHDGGPAVGIVVADSLSALLSDGYTVDSRQGARRVMGRLARFARTADVVFPVLHHLTKDGRVAGSPAVLDGVRLAFMIERDPDRPDVRTITRHKANGSAAHPQQYVLAGEGASTHAVFTLAADNRAERVRRAAPGEVPAERDPGSFRSRLAALRTRATPDEGSAGRYRCLARVQRSGRLEPGRLVTDGVTVGEARDAAERDAGCALTWQTAPSGMLVATVARPGGERVSYGVYSSAKN
jgi:AAA domain